MKIFWLGHVETGHWWWFKVKPTVSFITMFLNYRSPWWYLSTTGQQKCEDKVTKFQLPISVEQKITPQGQGANKTLVISKCNATDMFPHLCGWQQLVCRNNTALLHWFKEVSWGILKWTINLTLNGNNIYPFKEFLH